MVNLAPFIGAKVASKESIPCSVSAVDGDLVQVTAGYPYRSVTLWVAADWIESRQAESAEEELAASVS